MVHDIALILGLGLAVLVLPVALSAWSDQRPPRLAAGLALTATALLLLAKLTARPGDGFAEVAEVLFRLLARLLP